MAEALKEATWTSFTQKHKLELDDGPLKKALAKAEKADDGKPEARLEALRALAEAVPKQVTALVKRKKELGDKLFGETKDKLYAILDEAEKQIKSVQKALEGDDDDGDAPALLGAKMLPLVRELRKGEVQMHALIGWSGKQAALLIMRKPIAPTRRKLLAEAMGGGAGAKYAMATCQLEDQVLTFVVEGPAAGLAKRLAQALLDQIGLRLKVRVRGDDGSADEDGDADGETTDGEGEGDTPETPSPDEGRYRERLATLEPRVQEALRAGHAEATRLRALLGMASEKADGQRDFTAALRALDGIEKLLGSGGQPPVQTSGGGGSRLVHLQKARLAWLQTRDAVQAQLNTLEQGILDEYKDDDELEQVKQDVRRLDTIMEVLDDELADTLDAALSTEDEAERRQLQIAAREQIDGYSAYVASDSFLAAMDDNPFTPLKIRETVTRSLAILSKALV